MKVYVSPMADHEVEIHMPEELQSVDFADEYLPIQRLCDEICDNEIYDKVTVRFLNTLWIDNLAMIQLFLLLYKLKQTGKQIRFDLEYDADATEQVRFVKYMEDYGFLSMMETLEENGSKRIGLLPDSGYRELEAGNFQSSECLMPFTIIHRQEDVAEYIEGVINVFQNRFTNQFSEFEKGDFIFRMSIFLQETMGNAFEHGFADPRDGYCGVMIRYIHRSDNAKKRKRDYYSLKGNKKASRPFRSASFTLKNRLQLEEECNPYRNKTEIKIMENYMQIFVADAGMGFLKSMGISDAKMERNLINSVFEKGTERKKGKNTEVGGLKMLYQLLQQQENFISVKGEYNWIKIACTKKKDNNGTLEYVHKTGITSADVLRGFTIVGCIDCDYKRKRDFFVPVPRELADRIYREEYILEDMEEIENTEVIDFREEIPELSQISFNTDVILCFAGMNVDKGIWSSKLANYFKIPDEERKTLILVDIPEREARKYELIFEGFKLNVERAILLTQSVEVAVFTYSKFRQEAKLRFDREETENYKNSDSGGITRSLYTLLRAVRKYESQRFWQTVSERQGLKQMQLFINENVVWNVSGSREMDGYLDFSQACFDEKIRNILIYQLYRLPGPDNKQKYFESMDRFTEDLCENVNDKLKNSVKAKEYSRTQLGSVYVTGTSSKTSKINVKSDAENEYYYFLHSVNPADTERKINALLSWPSEKIANELFPKSCSEMKYERLAKTPFLAPRGTVYFAGQHYMDIKESIELKPDALYALLQKDSLWTKRLIQIAHIDMVNYHDYLYLNVVSVFNKHYMESRANGKYVEENSFDYLLKRMYFALGRRKGSYEKSIESDIQPEYRRIVRGKLELDIIPNTPGLFIYLTDYETMEIVSKLKVIFSDGMQKHIIPIAPVSKRRGSSALLVSPVLMENIREKLQIIEKENPGEETRVTIFIASVTSTKIQRELKHILYRLGAKQIKCLSLVDRQRFPLGSREKESYNSFCKIDLPKIGTENRCKLCLGISRIEKLKTRLISPQMQKRCDEIIFIWGNAKASDNLHGRGVPPQNCVISPRIQKRIEEICGQYQINKIEINTDVGLVLFSVENAAITMSVEFLMDCLEDDEMGDEIKILMISAHLLMFGSEEIVPADKRYLAQRLYELLQRQTVSNEYTALASAIILSQKKTIIELLHEHYKENWKWKRFQNTDFIIASVGMLGAVERNHQDGVLNYWVKKSREEYLDYLYGIFLLTDGNDITRHQTILAKIRESGFQCSKMDYISADNDVSFLKTAYQHMPHSYFADPEDYQKKRDNIVGIIEKVGELLEKAVDEGLEREERACLSQRTIEMFHCTSDFNRELFMKSTEEDLYSLRKKLQEVAKQARTYNRNGDISCYVKLIQADGISGTKYFCYLEDLQREILYLMSDFRHGDKENPMIGEDGKQYDGLVEVKLEESCMRYCFSNHVREGFSCEVVEKKKELKYNRPTILSLRMIFGREGKEPLFRYRLDEGARLFIVELQIPYLNV
ncbi:MAG: hypothetical protein HFG54_15245 [Lachnospiraceae bacterium]|jgi:hypothetical protein|nr:hypothetical protein [Lachnospiraceae bacterium]